MSQTLWAPRTAAIWLDRAITIGFILVAISWHLKGKEMRLREGASFRTAAKVWLGGVLNKTLIPRLFALPIFLDLRLAMSF